jgi:hypothetical protein
MPKAQQQRIGQSNNKANPFSVNQWTSGSQKGARRLRVLVFQLKSACCLEKVCSAIG